MVVVAAVIVSVITLVVVMSHMLSLYSYTSDGDAISTSQRASRGPVR